MTIGNGDTVDVNLGGNFPGSLNITLASNSTLQASAVIRLNNASVRVESGSRLTSTNGAFWDLDDADITFDDGALCTVDWWEQKDINTFTFNLGDTGFTALTPNRFLIGNGGLSGDISNATYIVDMAGYAGGDRTIDLIDFTADFENMNNSKFQGAGGLIITNAGDYPNSSITWHDATEAIHLNVTDSHWDGGAADGLWASATNWRGDLLPGAGGVVHLSNAVTVTSINGLMPDNVTIHLSGGAMLTRPDGVIRMGGATIHVSSGSGLAGQGFWDLNGADMTFDDGAIASMASWENKGKNRFTFNLGPDRIRTLTPVRFFMGGGWTTADGTYVVDMSSYTGSVREIELVDFTNNFAGVTAENFQDANLIVTNAGIYSGSTILFDEASAVIVLDVALAPVVWDGDGADMAWTTATNWNHDRVPVATDDVIVGSGAAVTNGQSDFDTLVIEAGASVTFSAALNGVLSNKTIDVSGTLDVPGVFRPGGSTIDLAGSLGPAMSGVDLSGGTTMHIVDGAAFSNTSMNVLFTDNPTLGLRLSENGFSPLQAGTLNVLPPWSNVTVNIDISAYTNRMENSFLLIDFTNYSAGVLGPFNPDITVTTGGSGLGAALAFDTNTFGLFLKVGEPAVWDGDAGDGLWRNPLNWSLDTLPAPGDTVSITNGDTVATTGISVIHPANQLPGQATVNLSGQSRLTDGGDGLLRLAGATLNVWAGSGLTGGFWDLNAATLNFEDGAIATVNDREHKGANVFGFRLIATGFTTLTPGILRSGAGALWSDVTYNIDVSGYNTANGTNLVLMDFTSGPAAYTNTFNPAVNITGQNGGTLRFDTTEWQLILDVVPIPARGLTLIVR